MPYTQRAHNYFEAVAHSMATKPGGPSKAQAAKMASEGIKKGPSPKPTPAKGAGVINRAK